MTTDDTMTDSMLAAHVRGYAHAVRLHLADLGPEVTEDLTDGLEADLTEALADAAGQVGTMTTTARDDVVLDLTAHFGPAQAYAAELRSAAGLPPAGPPRRGVRARIAARWQRRADRWARQLEPLTSTPQWAALRGLAGELRPAWWLARGWIIAALLVAWFSGDGGLGLVPMTAAQAAIYIGCALVSVQWARGRWMPADWLPRATATATVIAVLLIPGVLNGTSHQAAYGSSAGLSSYEVGYQDGVTDAYPDYRQIGFSGEPGEDGVWVDGMQVANLFAFDAAGEPVKDIQLYDDRGRPVRTITDDGAQYAWEVPQVDGSWYFRPATASDGRSRWNVYPLQTLPESGVEIDEDGRVTPIVGVRPESMPWPFLKAPVAIEPDDGAAGGGTADDGATADDTVDEGEGAEGEAPETPDEAPTEAPASGTPVEPRPAPTSVVDASPER